MRRRIEAAMVDSKRMRAAVLGVMAFAGAACDKPTTTTETARVEPTPSASAVSPASASATPVAVASAEPAAAPGSAAPSSSSSAKAAASAAPAASGSAKAAASASPSGPPLQPASARVEGKNFALDVASPGCRADTDCVVTIKLSPTGGYHVNKEYPYKFVGQPAATHAFLGKDDPNTFSKAAGDYREDGEKAATMTVRFRAKTAGEAKVTGTYKMSVCSAENCQIETPRVELAVAVK